MLGALTPQQLTGLVLVGVFLAFVFATVAIAVVRR